MKETPIDYNIVKQKIQDSGLPVLGKGSIREIVRIVNNIEQDTNKKFIRMEMGVPGINPPEIGTNAEIKALKGGVASKYPMIEGIAKIKPEISRFVKLFMDIDVKPENCIPSVGSMQGAYATFMVGCRRDIKKDTLLFIDPGFPVQKQQMNVMGLKYDSFDVYNYRGEELKIKLESHLKNGNINCIVYSNPNNPSWICFTDKELKTIGDLANKYDVIVVEDLAYFGMDFRKDYSQPGLPPYQPSVANYTDNYILLISSSKAFSYAGQRIGSMVISDKLARRKFPDLTRFFTSDEFGYAIVYGALYSLSSGVAHSVQYGFAAMLKAANDGKFNFVDSVKIYGKNAKRMKKIFLDNGFDIVYDKDEGNPIADGFYFTVSYPGFSGIELIEEFLYYGVSAISLDITGSKRSEGLRACVSQIKEEQFDILKFRLEKFNEHHPIK